MTILLPLLLSCAPLGVPMPDLLTQPESFRIASSRAGTPIEGLRFTASGSSPVLNKPAILVVANLDGRRPDASEVARKLAERLSAGGDGAAALLEAATIYVIAEPNPDAAALAAATPLIESVATGTGRDNDRDGLVGEDPPADVDGDGLVTWMRVPDPDGTWLASPFDPRVNVEADAAHAERGKWKLVREGFDADGDGEASEDAAQDAEVNRNFPAGFEEHSAQGGLFAGDEPEARGLMDFVLEHPELALVITLDDQDTLVSAPETTKDPATGGGFFFGPRELPDGKLLQSDADVLAELGRRFGEYAEDAPEAESMVPGSFQRWCYEQRGILTLDSALWVMPTEAPEAAPDEAEAEVEEEAMEAVEEAPASQPTEEEGPDTWRKASDDVGRLEWVDATGEAWRFVDWHAFDHPQLGPVEIGGWAPYAKVRPPAEVVERVADEQWQLLTSLTEVLPRVEVASFTAEDLGKGLWRVEARIEDPALMPLVTRAAARARTATRARVELELPNKASVIAGQSPGFIRSLDGLGRSDEGAEFTWLVQARSIDDLRLKVTTRTAGDASATVTKKEAR